MPERISFPFTKRRASASNWPNRRTVPRNSSSITHANYIAAPLSAFGKESRSERRPWRKRTRATKMKKKKKKEEEKKKIEVKKKKMKKQEKKPEEEDEVREGLFSLSPSRLDRFNLYARRGWTAGV
ncbi:hypothetical protein PUN28_003780 [Cardiocondyla obscurior]|uniref:Uncharacterized protein n=1 Tax=Cardiocondyla obscurior TaxID=286306 RepID=A0AAW2GN71_9HYME